MIGTTVQMVVDLITILHQEGGYIVDAIRQSMASKGKNATGRTSKSLRYEVKQDGFKTTLRVLGKPFIMVVETGRKPTPSYKPSYEFVQSIKIWAKSKGIEQGAAYAIAKSIHQKGTTGIPGIISDVVNDNLIARISKDLLSKFAGAYLNNIKQQYASNRN